MDATNSAQAQKSENSEQIEAIYNVAILKIKELEEKQKKIVADFIKELEQRKVEELRKKLSETNN